MPMIRSCHNMLKIIVGTPHLETLMTENRNFVIKYSIYH